MTRAGSSQRALVLATGLLLLLSLGLNATATAADADAGSASRVHVVVPGDTAYSLSKRYHIPQDVLLAVNGLASHQQLKAGARLTIPGRAAAGPPPSRTASRDVVRAEVPARPQPAVKTAPAAKPKAAGGKARRKAPPALDLASQAAPPADVLNLKAPPPPGLAPAQPLTQFHVNYRLMVEPEYKNPGLSLLSTNDGVEEDFQGYAAGLKARLQTEKDTAVLGALGYSVNYSITRSGEGLSGTKADVGFGGLGAGFGMRRSF